MRLALASSWCSCLSVGGLDPGSSSALRARGCARGPLVVTHPRPPPGTCWASAGRTGRGAGDPAAALAFVAAVVSCGGVPRQPEGRASTRVGAPDCHHVGHRQALLESGRRPPARDPASPEGATVAELAAAALEAEAAGRRGGGGPRGGPTASSSTPSGHRGPGASRATSFPRQPIQFRCAGHDAGRDARARWSSAWRRRTLTPEIRGRSARRDRAG